MFKNNTYSISGNDYNKDNDKDDIISGVDVPDNPDDALQVALSLGKRWPDGEKEIIKSPHCIYVYAVRIKGRWIEAEHVISTDPFISYCYSKDIIKGRWELGEKEIFKNGEYSFRYAKDVINGRVKDAEQVILSSIYAVPYVEEIMCQYISVEELLEKIWDCHSKQIKCGQEIMPFLIKKYSELTDGGKPGFLA